MKDETFSTLTRKTVYGFQYLGGEVKNRVALIVISDNLNEETEVRVISTASSEGMIFSFDWGASSDFVYQVRDILSNFIMDDAK